MRCEHSDWNDRVPHRPAEHRGADIVTVTARPTPGPAGHQGDEPIGELVAEVSKSLSTLLHSEIELAKLELKISVKNAGVGVGFFGAALVLLVFSLTFGFIALAEGIHAMGVWRWLSYLIVFLFFVIVAGLFVFMGVKKVKRVKAPERTIATSKDTVAYLKANTKRG
jgi:hypothetical protein